MSCNDDSLRVAVSPPPAISPPTTAAIDIETSNMTTIVDLTAQLEALQRQLDQCRAENSAKDRTIASLRQQIQRGQELQDRRSYKQGGGTPETVILSPQTANNLDSKMGKFLRNKLFNANEQDLSEIQNDVDDEIRYFFEQKLTTMHQDVVAAEETEEFEHDDDDSCSTASDFDCSIHSGFSSTTSFSVLQQQCFERIRNQQLKEFSRFDSNASNAEISSTTSNYVYGSGVGGVHDVVDQIQRWLFLEGGNLRDVPSLLTEYCKFCRTQCNLPHLDRLFVAGMMLPPQISAYVWQWEHGKDFQEREVPHSAFEKPNYNPDEPFSVLMEGRAMEYRLKAGQPVPSGCTWFTEDKYQDYLALPIYFRGEFVGAMAWATKSQSGFSNQDIQVFYESLLALSTVLRLHTNDIIMNTLQERLSQHVETQTRDLAEANHRLAAANAKVMKQAQDQLKHFAMMSHEIRTPLNCIVGLSNLLLDNPHKPLDPEVEESISMITASGDLLLAVVDDVLDYSKLATGNVEIEIAPTDVRRTIRPVVESIRMKAASISKEHKLELRTRITEDLPEYVDLDGRRLQQILYNLLGNAIKFGRRGTYVDFNVQVAPGDANLSSSNYDESKKPESHIVFSIKDFGKGIAKKDMQSIFQPFQQSASNDAADGGTGLGLAITAQLCKVLGGNVTVTSEEGKWSEFVVRLPLIVSKDTPIRPSASQCNLTEIDSDDKRTRFQSSVLTERRSSKKLTADLLTNFHESNRSFHATPRVSPLCAFQRSKSDKSLSDNVPGAPLTSPREKPRVLSVQEGPAKNPVRNLPPMPDVTGSESRAATDANQFGTLRVLIAEDNLVNQKVLTRTLTKLGVTNIDVVPNGQEAVNKSAVQTFDVIFMDWCMPVMDGLEATKLIVARRKEQPEAVHPGIVFLTAHALDDYRERAIEAGGDGFISKPFKVAAIKEFLERCKMLGQQHSIGDGIQQQ